MRQVAAGMSISLLTVLGTVAVAADRFVTTSAFRLRADLFRTARRLRTLPEGEHLTSLDRHSDYAGDGAPPSYLFRIGLNAFGSREPPPRYRSAQALQRVVGVVVGHTARRRPTLRRRHCRGEPSH